MTDHPYIERIPAEKLQPGDRFRYNGPWVTCHSVVDIERDAIGPARMRCRGLIVLLRSKARSTPNIFVPDGELVEVDRTPRLIDMPQQPSEK